MTGTTQQVEVIGERELHQLATRALRSYGAPEADAAACADILVMADLFGIHTHGVSRIESYGERLAIGGINPTPRITSTRLAPGLVAVDGNNGLGPVVGGKALQAALDAAKEVGIAAAFVRGSNHFGPIIPYCWRAAEAGCASIIASNATTTIAPTGGKEAKLGNNPFALGMPNPGGRPVILDMALSVVARAKIRDARDRGQSIPDTWATDAQGFPTTDPAAALDGILLPVGGYKGYGLSTMIDLFAGLASGAAFLTDVKSWVDEPDKPQNLGHFFIIIDVSKMMTPAELMARMARFTDILHATPPADPARPVLLCGEPEIARYEAARRDGIKLPASQLKKLRLRAEESRT